MLLFIPRSLCALKRFAAKTDHVRYGATTGIRFWSANGMYRAEATDGRRAIVVQGMLPEETPNWPGLKDLPDDAFETIIAPKDLEKGCKVGDEYLQKTWKVVGLATNGNYIQLGLGDDCVTARVVDGRFPQIDNVIPKDPPLFSVKVHPKLLAEALLTMSDLLSEADQAVDLFYYGEGVPLGLCARDVTGVMIDALVVPLMRPAKGVPQTPDEAQDEQPVDEAEEQPADEPAEEPEEQPAEPEAEQPAEEKPSKKRRRKTAKA